MKSSLLLFTLFFLFTACTSERKEYQLKLNKGKVYLQDAVHTVNTSYSLEGYDVNILTSTLEKASFKVLEEYDSYYDMEVRYHSLTMRVLREGVLHEFSSSRKDDPDDIYSSILRNMIDKPFHIKMSKKGKILEVKKIDGLFQHMLDDFPYLLQEERKEITNDIIQAFGESAFKKNAEMGTYIYPDKPVQEGDKWKIQINIKSLIDAEIDTEYELTRVFPAHLELSGKSSLNLVHDKSYAEVQGMLVKYEMEGELSSELKVDLKTGWTVEAKVQQNMKGKAYVKANETLPSGATIPMDIKSKSVISGL